MRMTLTSWRWSRRSLPTAWMLPPLTTTPPRWLWGHVLGVLVRFGWSCLPTFEHRQWLPFRLRGVA